MRTNKVLWGIQGLLAALFAFAGGMKLVLPIEAMQQGPVALPGPFLRFIGVAEVCGAVGLILPWALRIQPRLTPLAASGLMVIMTGATLITASQGPAQLVNLPARLVSRLTGGLVVRTRGLRPQHGPRVLDVVLQLRDQRVDAVELALTAQEVSEAHFRPFAVEIALEVQ